MLVVVPEVLQVATLVIVNAQSIFYSDSLFIQTEISINSAIFIDGLPIIVTFYRFRVLICLAIIIQPNQNPGSLLLDIAIYVLRACSTRFIELLVKI